MLRGTYISDVDADTQLSSPIGENKIRYKYSRILGCLDHQSGVDGKLGRQVPHSDYCLTLVVAYYRALQACGKARYDSE